jgi:hypothetical protein
MPLNGSLPASPLWALVSAALVAVAEIWDLEWSKCAFACDAQTGPPVNKITATRNTFTKRFAQDKTLRRASRVLAERRPMICPEPFIVRKVVFDRGSVKTIAKFGLRKLTQRLI